MTSRHGGPEHGIVMMTDKISSNEMNPKFSGAKNSWQEAIKKILKRKIKVKNFLEVLLKVVTAKVT